MFNELSKFISVICVALTINCYGQLKQVDDKLAIIKDESYIEWFTGEDFKMWTPNSADLMMANEILVDAINNGEFYFLKTKSISELKRNYYRQYLCYVDANGEKIIYINSRCKLSTDYDKNNKPVKFDWKTKMVKTADGGECYWNIKINVTTHKYLELKINMQG